MRKAFITSALLGAVIVLTMAGTAQAGQSLSSLIEFSGVAPGVQNTGSDDSREYLIDNDNDGKVSEGDYLRGILNINSMIDSVNLNLTNIGGNSPYNELTSLFMVEVYGKSDVADVNGKFNFSFAPTTAFVEANSLLGVGSGAMLLFYEDSANDFSVKYGIDTTALGPPYVRAPHPDAGTESDEYFASNGTFVWAMGFNGAMLDPDAVPDLDGDEITTLGEGWSATAFDDPTLVAGTDLGSGNFDFNRIFGGSGAWDSWVLDTFTSQFDATKQVEFTGDTQFQTGGATSGPWPIENEAQFNFKAISVPLPSAVWAGLAMLGALGFGANRRRKRSV